MYRDQKKLFIYLKKTLEVNFGTKLFDWKVLRPLTACSSVSFHSFQVLILQEYIYVLSLKKLDPIGNSAQLSRVQQQQSQLILMLISLLQYYSYIYCHPQKMCQILKKSLNLKVWFIIYFLIFFKVFLQIPMYDCNRAYYCQPSHKNLGGTSSCKAYA